MEQVIIGLIAFLAIWGIIALLYRQLGLSRYGFSLKPFILIVRSKRIAKKLETVGISISKPWKLFMNLGVVLSGGLMAFAFYILISNLIVRLTTTTQAGLYVIIPGLTIGWHVVPYFVLAAAITIIIHEAFHAISFGSERVPIKSFGVFFAVILPGGLVEADNEAFNSSKPLSKMRIYASGSFSNFIVFLLAVGLIALTVSSTPNGVLVFDTLEGYPAHGVLKSWDVIISINGHRVYNVNDLDKVLSRIPPGTRINIEVLRGDDYITVSLITASNPSNKSKSFMGVDISNYYPSTIPWLKGQAYWHWVSSLYWLRLVSFSVAIINMLPIPLLDGSGFIKSLLEGLLKNRKRANDLIVNLLGSISLFLLLANIMVPVMRP
ncbi:MAG: hypothetical protein DRJ60_01635 [Thermoprotei archaeon]|nr:MAG: hypothetical protein DRJ60_01635 [Thermoprotei archaeon]